MSASMAEELRSSEDVYRTLFEECKDAIVITRPDGTILDANPTALDLSGYSRQEVIGMNILAGYVDAADRLRIQRELEERGYIRDCEVKMRRKDGAVLDILLTSVAHRDKNGTVVSYQTIGRDVTARKKAEAEIRELSNRLLRLQDEERRRLARELHDATAQSLAAAISNVSLIEQCSARLNRKARNAVSEALHLMGRCLAEIRTLSYLLHPPLLEELGLASATQHFVEGFARRTGIRVHVEVSPELGRFPVEIEMTMFRIIQESLTNVRRHSGSATATIRITRNPTDVALTISDTGCRSVLSTTAESGAPTLGVGIAGMKERVRQLKGNLEAHFGTEGGRILAVIPLAGGGA